MTNPMVEEKNFFSFFWTQNDSIRKKKWKKNFSIFFQNFENFEILGPHGTLKTPW